MKNMAGFVSSFALLVIASAVLAGTNQPAVSAPDKTVALDLSALFSDPIIARAEGVEIKLSQLEDSVAAYKARMAEDKKDLPEARRPFIEKKLLEDLAVTKILYLRATPEDKAKAAARLDQVIGSYRTNAGSEEALRRQLKLRGRTLERFRIDVLEEETAHRVMERELKSKITISDAQVQEFYTNGNDGLVRIMQETLERMAKDPDSKPDQLAATKKRIDELKQANLAKLQFPEKVRVSHILLSIYDRNTEQALPDEKKKLKREMAEKLLLRARAGENFTNLVQQYSEDRNLPETHGEYVVTRAGALVPEFKAASFSLTNNQISDIVTTLFGYHIIKQLERIPAQKAEYSKVVAELRTALLEQEFEQRIPEYFNNLKREAKFEILDPKYRFDSAADELLKKPGT